MFLHREDSEKLIVEEIYETYLKNLSQLFMIQRFLLWFEKSHNYTHPHLLL